MASRANHRRHLGRRRPACRPLLVQLPVAPRLGVARSSARLGAGLAHLVELLEQRLVASCPKRIAPSHRHRTLGSPFRREPHLEVRHPSGTSHKRTGTPWLWLQNLYLWPTESFCGSETESSDVAPYLLDRGI